MTRSTKAPVFHMNEIVRANWSEGPLLRNEEYRIVDIYRYGETREIRAYRLSSPFLREDVLIEKPTWKALSKAPHGLHEDVDSRNTAFSSVPISEIRVGDIIVAQDPYGRTSYGLGGKGVFEVLAKPGKVNVKVLSANQLTPNGPVYRSELSIPLIHVSEVKRVQYR